MKSPWKILSGFFALQLAIFLAVNQKEKQIDVYRTHQKLIAFDANKIDKIELEDQNKKAVVLIRNSNNWVISSLYDFPALSQKAESLLNNLLNNTKSWPAGTSNNAAKKLGTNEDNFEKRLKLFANNKLVHTLYIGTSPSFKKAHVRLAGDQNSYAIAFNSFDFPTDSNEWIERSQYSLKRNNVKELKVKNLVIQNENPDSEATIHELAANEVPKSSEINQIFNQSLSPSYHKVLGKDSLKDLGTEVLNYEVRTNEGKQKKYQFYQFKKTEPKNDKETADLVQNYIMKVSDSPYFLEVDKSSIEGILKLKREDLVQKIKKGSDKEVITMKSKESNTQH